MGKHGKDKNSESELETETPHFAYSTFTIRDHPDLRWHHMGYM